MHQKFGNLAQNIRIKKTIYRVVFNREKYFSYTFPVL